MPVGQVSNWPPPLVKSLMMSLLPTRKAAEYTTLLNEALKSGDFALVKRYDCNLFKCLAFYAVRRGKTAEALLREGLARIVNSNPCDYMRWQCECTNKYLRMISKS